MWVLSRNMPHAEHPGHGWELEWPKRPTFQSLAKRHVRVDVFAPYGWNKISGNMGYTEYEWKLMYIAWVSCDTTSLSFKKTGLTQKTHIETRITKQEFFPQMALVDTAVSQIVKQRRKVPTASWENAGVIHSSWEIFLFKIIPSLKLT